MRLPPTPAAFRNVPGLMHLDASILPSNALPIRASFALQSFRHDNLIIGIDALAFLSNQSNIRDLCINPYSYYEASENYHVAKPSDLFGLTYILLTASLQ